MKYNERVSRTVNLLQSLGFIGPQAAIEISSTNCIDYGMHDVSIDGHWASRSIAEGDAQAAQSRV